MVKQYCKYYFNYFSESSDISVEKPIHTDRAKALKAFIKSITKPHKQTPFITTIHA